MSIGILGAQIFGAAGLMALGSRQHAASPAQPEGSRRTDNAGYGGWGSRFGESGVSPGNISDSAGTGARDGRMQGAGRTDKGRFDRNECQTCKKRRYQDGSNDPGVSFKAPTAISADNAAAAVMGHEQEHVTREQAKAQSEGREVISQSVILHNAICPECGRTYVSGGETRTVTGERKRENPYDVGKEAKAAQSGKYLDAVA